MGIGGGEVVNLFLVYMQMDLSGYDNRSNSSNETSKDEYFWQVPQPDFLNPAQELLLKILEYIFRHYIISSSLVKVNQLAWSY